MTSPTDPGGSPTWRDLLSRAQKWADENPDKRLPPAHDQDVTWDDMPPPWRWHRCWAQSWGSCGPFAFLLRCPCGAVRLDGEGPWLDRNSRRRIPPRHGIGPSSGGENVGDDDIALIQELRQALRKGTPQ